MDAVGVGDDQAAGGLAEDLRQPHRGHALRGDHVAPAPPPAPPRAAGRRRPPAPGACRRPARANRSAARRTSIIDASSTTSRSASSGLPASRPKRPSLGCHSSSRCRVLAGWPVASRQALGRAAGGRGQLDVQPCAARICTMPRTMVVLPTPGPPVTTTTGERSTWRRASACWGARRQLRLLLVGGDGRRPPRPATAPARTGAPASRVSSAAARRSACHSDVSYTARAVVDRHQVTSPSMPSRSMAASTRVTSTPRRSAVDLAQLLPGQVAVPRAARLVQDVADPGRHAHLGVLWNAQRHGQAIGRQEADAPDVVGQLVGVAAHAGDGGVGALALVVPVHACGEAAGQPVALEEHHHLADVPLLGPGLLDRPGPRPADAGHLHDARREWRRGSPASCRRTWRRSESRTRGRCP